MLERQVKAVVEAMAGIPKPAAAYKKMLDGQMEAAAEAMCDLRQGRREGDQPKQ